MLSKITVVTGQTATGKTNFAINLALKNDGELVNVDSRQIYKKLDIVKFVFPVAVCPVTTVI